MLWRRQSSLVKPLEPSSRAAFCEGPNTLMPASASRSARPIASGTSGPDHDEIDLFRRWASATWPAMSSARDFDAFARPGRCRHCRARRTALCTGARPKWPSTAHVRGRRRPRPGFGMARL